MKYRKKPVVIEAWQWTDAEKIPPAPHMELREVQTTHTFRKSTYHWELAIHGNWFPLELLDWIILGIGGEYYSCKPAIFEQTYEKA